MKSSIEQWQTEFQELGPAQSRGRGAKAIRLRDLYEALSVQLYDQYEPTKRPSYRISRDFLQRIEKWLGKFPSDQDRWVAFQSIEYIFFAGLREFEELYRCAYEHAILRWIVDSENIDIFSNDAACLQTALNSCWPCPVTDSLRINGFLHVTGMRGKSLRPDWLSLRDLGSQERIQDFVKTNGIKYLILLEDFVGSGSQICRALTYAAKVFPGAILVIPLIICAPGDAMIKRHISRLNRTNISYKPQVVIEQSCLVGPDAHPDEPSLFPKLREVIQRAHPTILGNRAPWVSGEEYGYKKVGSLVVLYSNCPNNTPPIYHKTTAGWPPPFPRSSRL